MFVAQTRFGAVHWFAKPNDLFRPNVALCGRSITGALTPHITLGRYSVCRRCYRKAMKAGEPADKQLQTMVDVFRDYHAEMTKLFGAPNA